MIRNQNRYNRRKNKNDRHRRNEQRRMCMRKLPFGKRVVDNLQQFLIDLKARPASVVSHVFDYKDPKCSDSSNG